MAAHNELGKWGEETAVRYLKRKGLYIRHRDWHCGHKDIDIVATDEYGTQVIFFVFKTRSNTLFTVPELAVDREKIANLRSAANAYVKQFRINADLRFDIVTVVGTSDADVVVNHIENAF